MKISKILVLLIGLVLIIGSCTEMDTYVEENLVDLNFVSVNLPGEIQFKHENLKISEIEIDEEIFEIHAIDSNGEVVKGFIKFVIPDIEDEKLILLEVTNNILDQTILDEDFFLAFSEDLNGGINTRIQSSCVASCHSTFTDGDGNKIKGRGGCKAQCWAGAVATVAAAVIIAIL
jgi:hypothetical protein